MSEGLMESPVTSLGCSMTWFAPVWVLEARGEDWGCPEEPGKVVLERGRSVLPPVPEGLGEVAAVPMGGLPGGSVPTQPLAGREGPPVPVRQWGKAHERTETG